MCLTSAANSAGLPRRDGNGTIFPRESWTSCGIESSIGVSKMPGKIVKFAKRCGTSVPDWLVHRFDGLDDDPETRRMIAAHFAIQQVRRLEE